MSRNKKLLVEQEIQELLSKGAISFVEHSKGEFISNIFLREKKDGRYRPVINLKYLNQILQYHHLNMEDLKQVKELLAEGDFMVKLDLQGAYSSISLHEETTKYVRSQWEGKLYEFLCLCFGVGPALRYFTKLLKIPISLMRRI